jgi:hypothetical protein
LPAAENLHRRPHLAMQQETSLTRSPLEATSSCGTVRPSAFAALSFAPSQRRRIGRSYGVSRLTISRLSMWREPLDWRLQGLSGPKGVFPRSPLDFARILHRLAAYCVVQATDWNYLLILSKRPPWRPIPVLWSANDRQGTANGRARHSPTSYVDWAVAMPRRYVARQAERWHFLGRVFSGACGWPLVSLRPV